MSNVKHLDGFRLEEMDSASYNQLLAAYRNRCIWLNNETDVELTKVYLSELRQIRDKIDQVNEEIAETVEL